MGCLFFVLTFTVYTLISTSDAQLTPNFYQESCPEALPTIRRVVEASRDTAPALLRVQFHDCFVQGCDASIMLDDSPTIISEQNAFQSFKTMRGLVVIDEIKSALEHVCPGTVSCADIVVVAARDATTLLNGPTWEVKLGRRDSLTASKDLAHLHLPFASTSLEGLISSFARHGLSMQDMVALSGAHSVGRASCKNIQSVLANGRSCTTAEDNPHLDYSFTGYSKSNEFDNMYFKELTKGRGLLLSDQVLYDNASTQDIVSNYSQNITAFFADFASAMVKMGEINPLMGKVGEVRKNCRELNRRFQ